MPCKSSGSNERGVGESTFFSAVKLEPTMSCWCLSQNRGSALLVLTRPAGAFGYIVVDVGDDHGASDNMGCFIKLHGIAGSPSHLSLNNHDEGK